MLSCPISDIQVIQKRQKLVKLLLDDENLFDRCSSLILNIKNIEGSVLNYWNYNAELNEAIEKIFYEPKKSNLSYLNKSGSYHQLNHLYSPIRVGISLAMLPGIPLVFIPVLVNIQKRGLEEELWGKKISGLGKSYYCWFGI